jgi:hypothetical protein
MITDAGVTNGVVIGNALDICVEPVRSSPGLVIDTKQKQDCTQQTEDCDKPESEADQTAEFCRKHNNGLWLDLTKCRTKNNNVNRKLTNLKEMRSLDHSSLGLRRSFIGANEDFAISYDRCRIFFAGY